MLREKQSIYTKNRYNIDPIFKSHRIVSRAINHMLAATGGSKNGYSCLLFLPWTFEEYVIYIEVLFSHPDNLTPDGKVWMTWENHGVYRKKDWDDNNTKTWFWQLDHIIPHSLFLYSTMDSDEFRACWSLSNLRPYSAKQNLIDGNRR